MGHLRKGWSTNQIYVYLPPSFVLYGLYILVLVEELNTLELKYMVALKLHTKELAWKAKLEGWELKTVFCSYFHEIVLRKPG